MVRAPGILTGTALCRRTKTVQKLMMEFGARLSFFRTIPSIRHCLTTGSRPSHTSTSSQRQFTRTLVHAVLGTLPSPDRITPWRVRKQHLPRASRRHTTYVCMPRGCWRAGLRVCGANLHQLATPTFTARCRSACWTERQRNRVRWWLPPAVVAAVCTRTA